MAGNRHGQEHSCRKETIHMRNLNRIMLVTSLSAAAVVTGLTGCSTFERNTSERTAGRIVDDRKIASNVRSELRKEPVYKFHDVDVKTFDGVVQLSGFVNSDDQKRRAEELARQVPGVIEVQNSISLKPNVGTYSPTGRNTSDQNYNYNNNHRNQPTSAPTTPPRNNNLNNNNSSSSSTPSSSSSSTSGTTTSGTSSSTNP